jgi:hypothetical protein
MAPFFQRLEGLGKLGMMKVMHSLLIACCGWGPMSLNKQAPPSALTTCSI